MIGMQVQTRSGDLSADVAKAVRWALQAEPGESLAVVGPGLGGDAVRLQDLLDPAAPLEVTMHQDFGWWMPDGDGDLAPELAAMLERANAVIMPTEPVTADGVRAAYWVDTGSKAHIRWVRPEPEDRLLAAFARLQARDELALSADARYLGSFRAHGLLVPVWDLDRDMHPKEWTAPVAAFAARLDETLAGLDDTPPTDAERRARDALAGKQVTLR
jgi:NADPH-dependent ferric siderophore reductase